MPTIGDNSIRLVQLSGGAGGAGSWSVVVQPNGDRTYTDSISGTTFTVPADNGNSGDILPVASSSSSDYFILHSQLLPTDDGTYVKFTDGVSFWYVQI